MQQQQQQQSIAIKGISLRLAVTADDVVAQVSLCLVLAQCNEMICSVRRNKCCWWSRRWFPNDQTIIKRSAFEQKCLAICNLHCKMKWNVSSSSSSSPSPSIRADPCSAMPSWMLERRMQQQYQYSSLMGRLTFSRRRLRRLDLCARIYLNVGGLCRRRCIHQQSDDERCWWRSVTRERFHFTYVLLYSR